MIEILLGLVLISAFTAFSFFMLWMRERDKVNQAVDKVKAHEELQRINEDIANGGDEYVSSVLREHTRDL